MNGSGMLILNAPWQFDVAMRPAMAALQVALGEAGAASRVEWLRAPA
jgi:23S rRNA (adenine2030-N6)-methyltransferase